MTQETLLNETNEENNANQTPNDENNIAPPVSTPPLSVAAEADMPPSEEDEDGKPNKRTRSLGEIRVARFMCDVLALGEEKEMHKNNLVLLDTPPFADTRSAEKWIMEQVEDDKSSFQEGQYTVIRVVKTLNIEIERIRTVKVTEV